MSAQYRDGVSVDIEPGSFTLNADGTGCLVSNVLDYDLTWRLDGDEIVLTVQGQTIRLKLCLVWSEENTTQVFSVAE